MHELEVLLSRLKMEHLSYHVESLLEQAAKKELNYREFLCMALQQEWNGRHQRGMESRLKQARLPWVKTLEQFDFTFQPGIDRKVVRELAGLAFVERCENVILLGPPGVGKTHLAIALGVKAVDAGHRVLFMPLDRLIATLMKAKQENRLERQLQQLSYARVLILDEIGYLPMNREEASLFFRLLNRRYEKASIILTSNKGFADWGEMFGDHVLATAILDRLLHQSNSSDSDQTVQAVRLRLGRKNFLFFGSAHGGERGALLYSLIGTCKLNDVDPESYLRHVPGVIADWPVNRVSELLPWRIALPAE